jgi:hydroxymethylglutaryl-CoA reductase
MVGQGTGQWRILQKLLECAPLGIMAKKLAAVGAEGQERGELALLIMELAAPTLLSGDGK